MPCLKTTLTTQDIADELGVSRVMVSTVINNRTRERGFSEETAQRIRAYLNRRGFVPSRHALALRQRAAGQIGILHCGMLYSHLITAVNRFLDELLAEPDTVELMVAKKDQLVGGLRQLIARGVSRLLWIHTHPQNEMTAIETLRPYLARFETIVIYNYFFRREDPWEAKLRSMGIRAVGVDREAGYLRVGKFLKRLGHTRVAFPELTEGLSPDGFHRHAAAVQSVGLKVFVSRRECTPFGPNPRYGAALANSLLELRRDHGITAACLGDDEIAGYTMVELLRRGVQIPKDLTVIGYDGMPFGSVFVVPLTTLVVPVEAMIARSLALLQSRTVRLWYCFPLKILARASHGPAAGGSGDR